MEYIGTSDLLTCGSFHKDHIFTLLYYRKLVISDKL